MKIDSDFSAFGSHYSKLAAIANPPFDPLASKIKNNDFALIKSTILANVKKVDASVLNQLSGDTQTLLQKMAF